MSFSKMVPLAVLTVLVVVGYFGWKFTARGAYEAAAYQVIEREGPLEIREYPPLMMATTEMQMAAQGNDGSFMRLFRYISGNNNTDQKVAMTVPVFMSPESPEVVGQMGFVLPQKTAEQGIPLPTNERVQIKERRGGSYAVLRFAGRMDESTCAAAEDTLRQWMQERGVTGDGSAEFAGYDPPWTPGPLRRNEVLLPIRP
ncbi:MAG TPA: SOUL heme-binding protein [Planctomycetaceae bacterium]|nr:SOUL heme-binding protein [Blastopirellula sp.]HAY79689.1 SOUL heme-binding protein [Planctomycetaceae bacterium]